MSDFAIVSADARVLVTGPRPEETWPHLVQDGCKVLPIEDAPRPEGAMRIPGDVTYQILPDRVIRTLPTAPASQGE